MTVSVLAEALGQFVALDGDYQKLATVARQQLRARETQRPAAAVILYLANVDRALRLYEEDELSGLQLQEWAEILEMNEHVEYERDAEETIASLLFTLSSPEINGPSHVTSCAICDGCSWIFEKHDRCHQCGGK